MPIFDALQNNRLIRYIKRAFIIRRSSSKCQSSYIAWREKEIRRVTSFSCRDEENYLLELQKLFCKVIFNLHDNVRQLDQRQYLAWLAAIDIFRLVQSGYLLLSRGYYENVAVFLRTALENIGFVIGIQDNNFLKAVVRGDKIEIGDLLRFMKQGEERTGRAWGLLSSLAHTTETRLDWILKAQKIEAVRVFPAFQREFARRTLLALSAQIVVRLTKLLELCRTSLSEELVNEIQNEITRMPKFFDDDIV